MSACRRGWASWLSGPESSITGLVTEKLPAAGMGFVHAPFERFPVALQRLPLGRAQRGGGGLSPCEPLQGGTVALALLGRAVHDERLGVRGILPTVSVRGALWLQQFSH